jgi:hypothetical protein
MQEEELLSFANEDEEPVLRERYVPSFAMGVRGETMIVLVGKKSLNRFAHSKKFTLAQRNLAELYWGKEYEAWKKRIEAKKAQVQKKKTP